MLTNTGHNITDDTITGHYINNTENNITITGHYMNNTGHNITINGHYINNKLG